MSDFIDCEAVRKAIKDSGLSQRELEARTGISKSTIQRYLAGDMANVPLDKIAALANAVNADVKEWLGWQSEEAEEDKITPADKEAREREKTMLDLFTQLGPDQQDSIIALLKGFSQN